ncbi:MAG: FG-GAP-like repeat-containing protein [bacterium]|nr:FG-GAP-like repeat-containing protein [bacterium]
MVFIFLSIFFVSTSLFAVVSPTPNWYTEANVANTNYGSSVSNAGDVNGDGYDDLIVGASGYENSETNEGRALLYLGSPTGLLTTPAWTVESNQASAFMGSCVSFAGDVNGDGYDDVLVSTPYYDDPDANEGKVEAYYGSASGLSATPNWVKEGNQTDVQFGNSASYAGDINGDGYDDIIIGAPYYDNGHADEGRVYVYYGSATGLDTIAAWQYESNQGSAVLGFAVSSAGDVNNDGYDDVLVGAFAYDNGQTNEGVAYVFYGSASGLAAAPNWTGESNQDQAFYGLAVSSAGDVNSDGYGDIIVGAYAYDNGETDEGRAYVYHGSASGLSATANWTNESNQANAHYGTAVGCAGDVNGNGYDDVIVGADWYANGEFNEGRAFVYYGNTSGLYAAPAWTGESNIASAGFGGCVSSVGDVNGDGGDDIAVGAMDLTNGQTGEGAAYVFYGSSESSLLGPFTLISPTGNDQSNFPTFYWHKPTGPVKDYKIFIDGGTVHFRDTITDTSRVTPYSLPDGEYIWYVIATDTLNETKNSTDIDTFRVDYTPPEKVSLVGPTNYSYTKYEINTFSWFAATDNFSGVATYDFILSTSADLTQDRIYLTDLTTTSLVDTLDFQSRYYWTVRARDAYGNIGDYSDIWTFEYDESNPALPNLIYPIAFEEVEDSNFICDWQQSTKSAPVVYHFELDTTTLFSSPLMSQTLAYDSLDVFLTEERTYYWRVEAVDSANNTSGWTNIDSFFLDVKVPQCVISEEGHDFGPIDLNKVYSYDGFYIKNSGDGVLNIDSITFDSQLWAFSFDTEYTYPIAVQPNDSIIFTVNAFCTIEDTIGDKYNINFYTNIYNVENWTFTPKAIFGLPCLIDSAKAFDGTVVAFGVDADDYVVVFFNQEISGDSLTSFNINSVLQLSNGHSWLDGFADFDTAYLNPTKTTAIIELSTQVSPPTIAVGDTIFPDSSSIYAAANGFFCHYPVIITGSFGTDTTKPSVPVLISPLDDANTASSTFLWHSSTDNLAGVAGYSLWYDDDSLFGSPDTARVTDTTYTASLLDFVYYWRVRAVDNLNNVSNWSSVWSFNYSPAGIYEKFMNETMTKTITEIQVSMNEVRFSNLSIDNSFAIYDITGKVIYEATGLNKGFHSFKTENLSSGLYFAKLRDGDTFVSKKVVVIK